LTLDADLLDITDKGAFMHRAHESMQTTNFLKPDAVAILNAV
jgi:hypothetical protein